MYFKMSQELLNNIKRLVADVFSEEDFNKGIEAFEYLLNIKNDQSNFDIEYGKYLNENSILSQEWNLISGCRVEGFLRKIGTLNGQNTHRRMLRDLYEDTGFYDWLDEQDIKDARANDIRNAANANNDRSGARFSIDNADASQYRGCSHYFYSYIITYQLRNGVKAHDNPVGDDFMKRFASIKCLFIVYMDQCIKNYTLICENYENEILTSRIDYMKFANERIESMDLFNRKFLQLCWLDSNNEQFSYDYNSCVKFIGEAGMGKTTQMRKMYFEIIELVKNGQKSVLPIWINLSEMSELQEVKFEEKVKGILGEYKQYYSLLLKNNKLMFFLDGYNEVLTKDMQDIVKRTLALDIDNIHKKNPKTIIAMTDRGMKSNPPCMSRNVQIYTFNGLSREEMRQYVAIKTEPDIACRVNDFLDEASTWITKTKMIPAKLNSLIDLINENIIPTDEDDFYDKYLDFILEREENEKKETRIEDLKYLLYIFAQKLSSPVDEMNQNEIIGLWLKEGQVGNLSEARRLFKIATEFPILVQGSNDKAFKFAYPQYYHKMYEGL